MAGGGGGKQARKKSSKLAKNKAFKKGCAPASLHPASGVCSPLRVCAQPEHEEPEAGH